MLKRATVIFKKDENKYFINPIDTMLEGGGIINSPFLVEYNLDCTKLFEKIMFVLNLSKQDVFRPNNFKVIDKEYISTIGLKNIKELYNNTLHLSIFVKDQNITFSPYENQGYKKGFVGLPISQKIMLPINSSKDELIRALELSLSRCK